MAPEKRLRKKPEAYDPNPPGSKHKMMSERSRKTKQKKKIKEKMKDFRSKKVGGKNTTEKVDDAGVSTKKVGGKNTTEKVDDAGVSTKKKSTKKKTTKNSSASKK